MGKLRRFRSVNTPNISVLLLKLASGKKPIEKLNDTMKRTITDWALPLTREGKFSKITDLRLNTNYVKEELKIVVFITLICAQNRPKKRPTMLELIEPLKEESKEKFTVLENDEMFKIPPAVGDDALSGAEGNVDSTTSDEKEPKGEIKKVELICIVTLASTNMEETQNMLKVCNQG
ncbi:PTI1-like tyrosine-protein kinase [Capsicum baccatum]|uniref:PTI1-like tyrosine-protein kinase n=1 Tax=Capsicum baccatum TaxID=33114 RepID=A0A2G2VGA5_CAPBA|nr:PTI1-like tyrosine-protein kinase [Capsicum baccatum]